MSFHYPRLMVKTIQIYIQTEAETESEALAKLAKIAKEVDKTIDKVLAQHAPQLHISPTNESWF